MFFFQLTLTGYLIRVSSHCSNIQLKSQSARNQWKPDVVSSSAHETSCSLQTPCRFFPRCELYAQIIFLFQTICRLHKFQTNFCAVILLQAGNT